MSVIAELTMRTPGAVLEDTLTSVPGARVEIESLHGLDPDRPFTVLWASGDDLAAFDERIRTDETVSDLRVLDQLEDRRLYRFQFTDAVDVVFYPKYVELGASLLGLSGQNGVWSARMRFPSREALSEFRTYCLEHDTSFRLECVYDEPEEIEDPLTERQREAVAVAFDAGYFEVPRDASLAEVAADLDVSQQAASERLRRAMRHLAADVVTR